MFMPLMLDADGETTLDTSCNGIKSVELIAGFNLRGKLYVSENVREK